MNNNLFRESSIDRVNSPEQLNEYIRVARPGVWVILAAIVLLLIGVVIWGIFGSIETQVETGIQVKDGRGACYVALEEAEKVKEGMKVTIGETEGSIISVDKSPVQANKSFDEYLMYLGGFAEGDFRVKAEIDAAGLADGIYKGIITVESIHPITFVIH